MKLSSDKCKMLDRPQDLAYFVSVEPYLHLLKPDMPCEYEVQVLVSL